MLPAWCCEPAELFFGEKLPVVPPNVQADDHRVELPPVEALEQIAGRCNLDFDQQLRVLSVHARDQHGELWPRNMVADAYGEALPGSRKCGERAIMCAQEIAGVFEEDGTLCRNMVKPRVTIGKDYMETTMPLVHISMRAGKSEAYRQAIFDSIYRAMRETFNVPEEDQFMTIRDICWYRPERRSRVYPGQRDEHHQLPNRKVLLADRRLTLAPGFRT